MAQTVDFKITTIEAIKPPATGRLEFKDTKIQGLYLRVTDKGVKTFSFVGRAKGSTRVERVTFGKYPTIKPDEARRRAQMLAGELAGGVSAATAARERRGELTLAELFTLYRASLDSKGKKQPEQVESLWRTHLEPHFGTRRLSEITGADVERWHRALPGQITRRREEEAAERRARDEARRALIAQAQAIRRHGPDPKPKSTEPPLSTFKVTGHRAANNALRVLRAMFNWAAEARRGHFTGANPAAGHDLFPEAQRDRFLQADELAPFFRALAEEPSAEVRDFALLAVLTGARRSNVVAMRWDEIELGRGEWRIKGELMKNGQPQTVTLAPEAVQLLEQRRKDIKGPWVFPSERSDSGHMTEPRKGWERILRRAGLADLRIHDLRRTLGSWQARTGASLVMIGKSLNHRSQEATAIYARLDLDPVRQSVERATSAMLEAAGVKPVAEVVALPTRKKAPARKKAAGW